MPERSVDAVCAEVTYFTDPLCCWSWGFEPQVRRLRTAYAGRLAWRLRMGGLICDWVRFNDPINSIHRPSQMAPLWLQATHVTGMPIDPCIWMESPPSSSWPSCIAVKAAELQSAMAADLYLRGLRQAVMVGRKDVGRADVLVELAAVLQKDRPDVFDAERFGRDMDGPIAKKAFEDDIREARFRGVGRFPCLMLRRPNATPVFLTGWRPYSSLHEAVLAFAPHLGPERSPVSAEAYRTYWGSVTDTELAEAVGEPAQARPSADIGSCGGDVSNSTRVEELSI